MKNKINLSAPYAILLEYHDPFQEYLPLVLASLWRNNNTNVCAKEIEKLKTENSKQKTEY